MEFENRRGAPTDRLRVKRRPLYFADHDGFLEGEIVDNDPMNVVYRHVSDADTVIGVGTWVRKK